MPENEIYFACIFLINVFILLLDFCKKYDSKLEITRCDKFFCNELSFGLSLICNL